MMITVNSVKNRHLKRFLEHIIYLVIVLVLIPSFFYFELCVVLPSVVGQWTIEYYVHFFCAMFLLLNIVGNLIYGVFTDTSIRGKFLNLPLNCYIDAKELDWAFCPECECHRPPRAWHCKMCNICILKRDHHCTFFACCVGYHNQRYFILFTMYVFISMVYAFWFNVQFLAKFITWNHGLVIAKFVFPLASFVVDFGSETIYVFLVVINVIVIAFTGFLFFYHFINVLNGRTVPEAKHSKKYYDRGWKLNIVEVFGQRCYLTWILPFITSHLPGNGIKWDIQDKQK